MGEWFNGSPAPTCCEEAQKYPTALVVLDIYEGDTRVTSAKWGAPRFEHLNFRGRPPEPKFCGWCGTKLPKLRRLDPLPKLLCVVTDGGYYCDTCSERLIACKCPHPAMGWELVSEEDKSCVACGHHRDFHVIAQGGHCRACSCLCYTQLKDNLDCEHGSICCWGKGNGEDVPECKCACLKCVGERDAEEETSI